MKNKTYNQHLSVNFHLWQPCNYHCGFCFAGFNDVKKSVLPKGHLTQAKAEDVVRQLAAYGFGKITFAGGEPTLCPWLDSLIGIAKDTGMATMLVTNGSRLNNEILKGYQSALDWVVLSIDSLQPEINLKGGRFQNQRILPDANHYNNIIKNIHSLGFKFKVNTVVHRFNKDEIMYGFIELAKPLRWKIFKVLPIENQNGDSFDNYKINDEEFALYLQRNTSDITEKIMVPEDNDAMSESYLMIDPAGRFFDNANSSYRYTQSITEIGVDAALQQTAFDFRKYVTRGAMYNW